MAATEDTKPTIDVLVEHLASGFGSEAFPDHEMRERVYARVVHEIVKMHLVNLHMLFSGEVLSIENDRFVNTGYLPFRFTAEQRSRAAASCRDLFAILLEKDLEPTQINAARADDRFQAFLSKTTSTGKTTGRRRRRG